jgi:hypothetical protein
MQRLTVRLIPMAAVLALLTAGTFYAQDHAASAKEAQAAKPNAPEIFCGHMKTGQLCPGNSQMFKLSAAQKEQYTQALNRYNKAVGEAQKQFLEEARTKAGLSETELALAQSWFAEGLNPEINKILATKTTK